MSINESDDMEEYEQHQFTIEDSYRINIEDFGSCDIPCHRKIFDNNSIKFANNSTRVFVTK